MGPIDELLAQHKRARSVAVRRYLLDAVERAVLLSDPGSIGERTRRAIAALDVDPAILAALDAPVPPHAVLLPLIADGGHGVTRLVYIGYRAGLPAESSLADDARRAVDEAIELAARIAAPPSPLASYGLFAAQPAALAGAVVEGRSLGAAAYVSAVSLFSGRPVRRGTLVSAELAGHAVRPVGGVRAKIDGALEARADLAQVVVASRDASAARAALGRRSKVEVVPVASLEALRDATLDAGDALSRDPEEDVAAARRVFVRGWDGYLWPTQREPLERLAGALPAARVDLRVETLTMLGAVARHLGAPEESLALLDGAQMLVASEAGEESVPDAVRSELTQHVALTLVKLCRFAEASRAAARAIALARRGHARGELLKAHGCAGLVELARGRVEVAVGHQERALEIVLEHRPASAARTCGYLVDALGRAGRLGDARAAFERGMSFVDDARTTKRGSREAWLRTALGGALVRAGRHEDARAALDSTVVRDAIAREPLPGLVARRWLGVALARGGETERGLDLLAAAPTAHGRALLPHVRFLASLSVLEEARQRATLDALGADAIARARRALVDVPVRGGAARYLGAAVARADRALGRQSADAARIGKALTALLDRAERLA